MSECARMRGWVREGMCASGLRIVKADVSEVVDVSLGVTFCPKVRGVPATPG
jgi:hypothetical protein